MTSGVVGGGRDERYVFGFVEEASVAERADVRSELEKGIENKFELVAIDGLVRGESPRQGGENGEHVRMLAELGSDLPPILVHRQTMRVVDGFHRLAAARLQGQRMIAVRFFDGSDGDAFVLAVQTNALHGLPLSLSDRAAAATRILAIHPEWSDRAIAEVAGLSPPTVCSLRSRRPGGSAETGMRRGRDGRLRPIDGSEGRKRVHAVMTSNPEISLRELARQAGVSPATARDVRLRVERGEDPVPTGQRRASGNASRPMDRSGQGGKSLQPDLTSVLRALQKDPALRFSESGRAFLRWAASHCIKPGEGKEIAATVPCHCTYLIIRLARLLSDEWRRLADELEYSKPKDGVST